MHLQRGKEYQTNALMLIQTTEMQRDDSGQPDMISKQCFSGQGQINPGLQRCLLQIKSIHATVTRKNVGKFVKPVIIIKRAGHDAEQVCSSDLLRALSRGVLTSVGSVLYTQYSVLFSPLSESQFHGNIAEKSYKALYRHTWTFQVLDFARNAGFQKWLDRVCF